MNRKLIGFGMRLYGTKREYKEYRVRGRFQMTGREEYAYERREEAMFRSKVVSRLAHASPPEEGFQALLEQEGRVLPMQNYAKQIYDGKS